MMPSPQSAACRNIRRTRSISILYQSVSGTVSAPTTASQASEICRTEMRHQTWIGICGWDLPPKYRLMPTDLVFTRSDGPASTGFGTTPGHGVHLLDIVQCVVNVEGPSELRLRVASSTCRIITKRQTLCRLPINTLALFVWMKIGSAIAPASTATAMASASTIRWERCSWTVPNSKPFQKKLPRREPIRVPR